MSRHPSHNVLRENLERFPFRSVVRLGSITEHDAHVQINSIESIKISSNKLEMKKHFNLAKVQTPIHTVINNINDIIEFANNDIIGYPVVAKSLYGSRGVGNYLLRNKDEIENWAKNKTFSNYIIEKYMNYALEYRLHVTRFGCFYACRKALKENTPEESKWRRHSDTCVWILETNPLFKKPKCWNNIVKDCVNALKEIGADILSFDVRVQSETKKDGSPRENVKYSLIECNSASSMKSELPISICAQKYLEIIPILLNDKY